MGSGGGGFRVKSNFGRDLDRLYKDSLNIGTLGMYGKVKKGEKAAEEAKRHARENDERDRRESLAAKRDLEARRRGYLSLMTTGPGVGLMGSSPSSRRRLGGF